jgi:hypothetical protein
VPEERSESRSFRIIPLICALLAIALGLLTLIGWISGVPLLASVRAKYIPMAPSTAFCFTLIGVGLICAPVEGSVTLDSTGCCIGRACGRVRKIGRNFWRFKLWHRSLVRA